MGGTAEKRARYHSGVFVARAKTIVMARRLGWGALALVGGMGFFSDELRRILDVDPTARGYLYLALLGLMGAYLLMWVAITLQELNLLDRWLNGSYQPPSDLAKVLLVILIGGGLAGLLLASRSPLVFGVAFFAFTGLAAAGIRSAHDPILRAVASDRKELAADAKMPELAERVEVLSEALDSIEAYWNVPRHLRRQKIVLALIAPGVLFATLAASLPDPRLDLPAYVWFIVVICVTEIWILRWRFRRDAQLGPLEVRRLSIENELASANWKFGPAP